MSVEQEGGDITYQHMVDDTRPQECSEIAQFYAGATVLVTGATGFLGKLLVEKLLRSCPDVKKILLLARAKKDKDPQQRLKEQFEDILYDNLKRVQPNFLEKIQIIEGDIGKEGVGLNEDDRKKIIDEVDIIFHGAATVRFDESLKVAIHTNVRGTKEILLLAHSCKKFRAFVYTSTAYSNCVRSQIDEEFYDSPLPADKVIELVDILNNRLLQQFQNDLLGDFPNTYAFSKSHAEDVIRQYSKGLAVAVVRPSMVISTASEPIAGWIDNVYGPTGVVVGAGLGILHCLHCDRDKVADMVPGDYVANVIIAAAWRAAKDRQENCEDLTQQLEPVIYNVVSSVEKPITWKSFMHYIELHGLDYPSVRALWCYLFFLVANEWLCVLLNFLLHWIPAYIVDAALYLMGEKPMLVNIYKKISKFSKMIRYFNKQEWEFKNANTKNLYDHMCPADRQTFNFDFTTFDWNAYFPNYIKGLRVYFVKDPVETIPEAKRKNYIFKFLQYIIGLALLYLLYALIKFVLFRIF